MKTNNPIKFKWGYETTFNHINKEEDTIYFISDNEGNNRIYVGDECYNVQIVTSLESGNTVPLSHKTVPSSIAVSNALNNKVNRCTLITRNGDFPTIELQLQNNTEYRYLQLNALEEITVKLPDDFPAYSAYLFYSSVILHNISSTKTVQEFIKLPDDSTQHIRFLNGDVDLNGMNTLEALFFSNGLNMCCIAAAYNSAEET